MAANVAAAIAALEVVLACEHHQGAFPIKIFALDERRAWACGVGVIRLHLCGAGDAGNLAFGVCGGQPGWFGKMKVSIGLTTVTRADYARAR